MRAEWRDDLPVVGRPESDVAAYVYLVCAACTIAVPSVFHWGRGNGWW